MASWMVRLRMERELYSRRNESVCARVHDAGIGRSPSSRPTSYSPAGGPTPPPRPRPTRSAERFHTLRLSPAGYRLRMPLAQALVAGLILPVRVGLAFTRSTLENIRPRLVQLAALIPVRRPALTASGSSSTT